MSNVPMGRVVTLGFVIGAVTASAVMGVYALRTVWVITRGRRWYQLKQL